MSESNIQLNADGAGKKVRTLKRTVGVDEVHEEVHNVADGAGNVIDPRKNNEVTSSVLPTGAATESTLGSVKAKTDNLDTPLSGVKSKTDNIPADPAREGGNLASLVAKDFATQTTLALVKAKTDNLDVALSLIKAKTDNVDVALSTRALESGGNLATIAGKDFATQTTLALVKAKTDNVDVALSTRALETGGNLATIAGKDFATQTTLALIKAKTDNITKADTDNVKVISETDGRTYKRANGSCSTSGNNTIVAAVAGKKIKVYDYSLQAQGTVTCQFQDGAGGGSIGQPWKLQDREGKNKHGIPPGAPQDFETSAATLLNLNLTAAVTVGYEVVYTDADAS